MMSKKKRSGKTGAPRENDHPERESTTTMMCTDIQECLQALLS